MKSKLLRPIPHGRNTSKPAPKKDTPKASTSHLTPAEQEENQA
jgi:hypothetical protein